MLILLADDEYPRALFPTKVIGYVLSCSGTPLVAGKQFFSSFSTVYSRDAYLGEIYDGGFGFYENLVCFDGTKTGGSRTDYVDYS